MTPFPAGLNRTWLPVCLSRELTAKPLSRQLAGVPLVLFRDAKGAAAALEDRCPHRNYPLSDGKVVDGAIRCPYHGWRFDGSGGCIEIPGTSEAVNAERLGARRIELVERHGAVFVRLEPDPQQPDLVLPPLLGDPDHDHFWWSQPPWKARALDALENILDPFHTNFVHDGLIRVSGKRQAVRQTVIQHADGVEVVYEQDEPDRGWMSRLLEGDRQRSVGRYYPPVTFQGRWEKKDSLTLCATAFFVPETQDRFRGFGCWTTPKGRAPAWLKRQAIMAFVRPVAVQDRRALERQYATIAAFGGPRFKSGPTDRVTTPLTRLYQGEALEPSVDGPNTIWL
ncbi:(2Fe-2S)-binding protein [Caulobacter sp. D4A]|uniref:aromatic ring-hydroxylating oxygenase subunit alpha n=1 Tax=unclassified Caulobacter TaxID=2648921 RepID=UPI000D727151|nr:MULTISPECIES: aromatic ring-hydroxylating dioxygenase subunit alpha [unclassified Caulobacter]PXA87348.1 (2Fe-2S)-binding protein [Caulobacter sp. D5]PXA90826.1 (2Fe-2S)-binding protein [Caulobacter sp. D4A]